jgi:hypothetical protein
MKLLDGGSVRRKALPNTKNKYRHIHALSGIRTYDPSVRADEDTYMPWTCGHCDRPFATCCLFNVGYSSIWSVRWLSKDYMAVHIGSWVVCRFAIDALVETVLTKSGSRSEMSRFQLEILETLPSAFCDDFYRSISFKITNKLRSDWFREVLVNIRFRTVWPLESLKL